MPALRIFFTALLLPFAFYAPGILAAQENGPCRPLAELCPAPQNPGRVDTNCYKAVAQDILDNSAQCADIWLASLPVRSRQVLALINLANESYWPVEDESQYQRVDEAITASLGVWADELKYSAPSQHPENAVTDEAKEGRVCPALEEVQEYLSCRNYKFTKDPNDREQWDEKDWTCFIDQSFDTTHNRHDLLNDFKAVPRDILTKVDLYKGCNPDFGINGKCAFAVMASEALGKNRYFESITGSWGVDFPYGPGLTSFIFLPDEGPPRLIYIKRCCTLLLLDYSDLAKTKLDLHLFAPKAVKGGKYCSQSLGKAEALDLD